MPIEKTNRKVKAREICLSGQSNPSHKTSQPVGSCEGPDEYANEIKVSDKVLLSRGGEGVSKRARPTERGTQPVVSTTGTRCSYHCVTAARRLTWPSIPQLDQSPDTRPPKCIPKRCGVSEDLSGFPGNKTVFRNQGSLRGSSRGEANSDAPECTS
jgi:hypothetical protein